MLTHVSAHVQSERGSGVVDDIAAFAAPDVQKTTSLIRDQGGQGPGFANVCQDDLANDRKRHGLGMAASALFVPMQYMPSS